MLIGRHSRRPLAGKAQDEQEFIWFSREVHLPGVVCGALSLMRWLFIPHQLTHNILPVALLSLISVPIDAFADADLSSAPTVTEEQVSGSTGIRPDHLWTVGYFDLLWNDTGSVMTAPARWDQNDWLVAGFSVAGIGAAASLDKTIKNQVQAHRTTGENRFFSQYQNLGDTWSFDVIGAFEVWGEVDGDTKAKNTAMDALTASIIGPGLIGTSVKYAVGRVRPCGGKRARAL
jgi:hypothetical protein